MTEYFEVSGVPGSYFKCPKGMGTLSVGACVRNFSEASTAKARATCRLMACDGCGLGAAHAGVSEAEVPMGAGLVCARCERQATRLIGGAVCVSCYNREREFLLGKNAKGNFPTKSAKIESEVVTVLSGPALCIKVKRLDRVVRGRGEGMRRLTIGESGRVRFAETISVPVCRQPHGSEGDQSAAMG